MGHTSAIQTFLNQHKGQLITAGVPEIYWEPLYRKLLTKNFDAGRSFQIVKIEYEEVREPHEPLWGLQAIKVLDKSDSENIYLIDHAWVFQINEARKHLEYDQLRYRMAQLLGVEESLPKAALIDQIFEKIWRVNNFYTVRNVEGSEQSHIWYILDELGSSVQHSDTPNCRIVPFVYLNDDVYSLLFLQDNIEEGDLVYRDFAEGITDVTPRKAALLPWIPSSFEDTDIKPKIPGEDYYISGHFPETLPDMMKAKHKLPIKDKYLCYSQYSLVKKYLADPKFELTEDEDQADILWYTEHFRDFKELSDSPVKLVNQFPYEYVITVKDLLCITCRRYKNNTEHPIWLPITYNLVNEIGNFVSYFQKCEKECKDNYWIIKPYNLARGMDMHITNNLNYIMRLPATGPKIAQKYLTNPVLFFRSDCEGKVKFDVRYVLLLKSVKPLQVYLYKNFFLRFANKPFELRDFDDYEKHFTVMNYTENVVLKHLKCEDFKIDWEKQYNNYSWCSVEQKIIKMVKEIMECATTIPPPCGIADSPQSRALYAADLMLDWENGEIEPKILEINFMPDCERACKYYPDFYNDIFKLLFLDKESDVFFKL